MTLDGVRPGDIALCDVRGAQFHIYVDERTATGVRVRRIIDAHLLPRGWRPREIAARDVVQIYRPSRRKTAAQRRAERADRERELVA